MKKITNYLILTFLIFNTFACSGYTPIFKPTNVKLNIVDYSISGDKKLGNQIYLKLNNLYRSLEKTGKEKDVFISIAVSKNKNSTSKDTTGKILSYRITLSTTIKIQDLAGQNILNENFTLSSSYDVQDQYSETVELENTSVNNLINQTYQDILIKLTDTIL